MPKEPTSWTHHFLEAVRHRFKPVDTFVATSKACKLLVKSGSTGLSYESVKAQICAPSTLIPAPSLPPPLSFQYVSRIQRQIWHECCPLCKGTGTGTGGLRGCVRRARTHYASPARRESRVHTGSFTVLQHIHCQGEEKMVAMPCVQKSLLTALRLIVTTTRLWSKSCDGAVQHNPIYTNTRYALPHPVLHHWPMIPSLKSVQSHQHLHRTFSAGPSIQK